MYILQQYIIPSQQELDLLFGPLYDEFFNDGTSRVNKSSSPTNNSVPQDTQPSTNIQPTSEPSTPTNAHAEENNVDQAEFTNPFVNILFVHRYKKLLSLPHAILLLAWRLSGSVVAYAAHKSLSKLPDGRIGEEGQSIGTQWPTKPKLDATCSGEPIDQTDYRSKIGSLMYLTSSRPDIVQAKVPFTWTLVSEGSCFDLTAFSDADHVGCLDTRKSTSGGIQFLGDKLVSWMSKKQYCAAMSPAEAEYVALSASCAQVMWMRTQLQDYGFNYNNKMSLS
ncbi:retrovirus-related pol polyprotein from transposon TNT 1-94 [Tanacetum coccineum]